MPGLARKAQNSVPFLKHNPRLCPAGLIGTFPWHVM
ncbi:MAG: hypothetical protein H6R19_3305 [Proteobacteria bacterium]|nr:hypothetical protein [Pseudomonadota bacterium]